MIPHIKSSALVIAATLMTTIILESLGQDAPSKKTYSPTGQEATLSGTITFEGIPPKPRRIDMSADPICYEHNPNPETEWFVVNNEKLANVLVYVSSKTLDAYQFASPTAQASLEHKGCRYEPHVMGIQTGQLLKITNSDHTQHNTHPTPRNNGEWNQTQGVGAPAIVKSFSRAELSIPFKDNQHPWEQAYVGVFNHPFFAVSDTNGNYKIEGLPPGLYTIMAWHERLGEKSAEVVLVPGESRYVGFTFGKSDMNSSK